MEKEVITIDNVDYEPDQLSDKQKALVSHVADLDQKIIMANYSLEQYTMAREGFYSMLKQELKQDEKS